MLCGVPRRALLRGRPARVVWESRCPGKENVLSLATNVSLAIGSAGALLGGSSLLVHWHSGRRVRVEISIETWRVQLNDAGDPVYDRLRWLELRVRSIGRLPITVDEWGFEFSNQPGGPDFMASSEAAPGEGKPESFEVPAGAVASCSRDEGTMSDLLEEAELATVAARGYVLLGTGQIKRSRQSVVWEP